MKKWIVGLMAVVLSAGLARADNNVYTGNADDGDFNNAANWWNSVTPDDNLFFRGDHIAANPGRANVNLSAPVSVYRINYQGTTLASAAYNITGTGGALTIDAVPANNTTQLSDVFSAVTADQTIAADLVLRTASNANSAHIRTQTGAGLILSGDVTQPSDSQGVGIAIGNGDVTLSGTVTGNAKLWKIHDNGEGSGVLNVTGRWSGGTLQIATGAEVFLNRSAADSTAMSGLLLQLVGGDLSLGNDEQIGDNVNLSFAAATAGTFNLDGNTETIGGLNFTATDASQSGSIDMGVDGILRLAAQDDTAKWGNLTVLNWAEGSDTIYVDGGAFSAAQLATITFDNWEPAGAKVEGGELLPTGSNVALSAYETWAADFGVGDGTNDFDADGLLNIYEYGLGGDPTNATDQGISPVYTADGGTLTYIYPQLSDLNSGLDYHLELRDDLVSGVWSNAGYAVTGTNIVAGDFNYVTNEVSTAVKSQQFIKLMIDTL